MGRAIVYLVSCIVFISRRDELSQSRYILITYLVEVPSSSGASFSFVWSFLPWKKWCKGAPRRGAVLPLHHFWCTTTSDQLAVGKTGALDVIFTPVHHCWNTNQE